MGLKRAVIRATYSDPDGNLGNRWKDGSTFIILKPADPATRGTWDTDRGSDIDSSGGSDHAIYKWDIVNHVIDLMVGGFQGDTETKTVCSLGRFNDYKPGAKGTGTFYFRKQGVPIDWEILTLDFAQ